MKENCGDGQIDQADRQPDRDGEIKYQFARLAAGSILVSEEINHGIGDGGPGSADQNETFGAFRSAVSVISNIVASLKLNMPAMMFVGKTSRFVL